MGFDHREDARKRLKKNSHRPTQTHTDRYAESKELCASASSVRDKGIHRRGKVKYAEGEDDESLEPGYELQFYWAL